MPKQHKSGKGGMRKLGRMLVRCASYKNRNQREKNKLKKLKRLLINHPKDKTLIKAIKNYENLL